MTWLAADFIWTRYEGGAANRSVALLFHSIHLLFGQEVCSWPFRSQPSKSISIGGTTHDKINFHFHDRPCRTDRPAVYRRKVRREDHPLQPGGPGVRKRPAVRELLQWRGGDQGHRRSKRRRGRRAENHLWGERRSVEPDRRNHDGRYQDVRPN